MTSGVDKTLLKLDCCCQYRNISINQILEFKNLTQSKPASTGAASSCEASIISSQDWPRIDGSTGPRSGIGRRWSERSFRFAEDRSSSSDPPSFDFDFVKSNDKNEGPNVIVYFHFGFWVLVNTEQSMCGFQVEHFWTEIVFVWFLFLDQLWTECTKAKPTGQNLWAVKALPCLT